MPGEKVTFISGFSPRRDVLGVVSIPDALLNEQRGVCRLFFFVNGSWGSFAQDFDFNAKSLTRSGAPDEGWWLLGKNGETVHIAVPDSSVAIGQIDGAGLITGGAYGYVNTIKDIDGDLYVCGYGRQVYRRLRQSWVSIADDILTQDYGRGFFDIDGADKENIYAVGRKGEIFFFDGQKWHQDSSPTNVQLGSLRCVSADQVWIAGNGGTVLRGSFGNWEVIASDEIEGNLYCVEEFNGEIYLAGNTVLAKVKNNEVRIVEMGLGKNFSTGRLHSREGIMWSIGDKHVLKFDGNEWEELPHPDNV